MKVSSKTHREDLALEEEAQRFDGFAIKGPVFGRSIVVDIVKAFVIYNKTKEEDEEEEEEEGEDRNLL